MCQKEAISNNQLLVTSVLNNFLISRFSFTYI